MIEKSSHHKRHLLDPLKAIEQAFSDQIVIDNIKASTPEEWAASALNLVHQQQLQLAQKIARERLSLAVSDDELKWALMQIINPESVKEEPQKGLEPEVALAPRTPKSKPAQPKRQSVKAVNHKEDEKGSEVDNQEKNQQPHRTAEMQEKWMPVQNNVTHIFQLVIKVCFMTGIGMLKVSDFISKC
jgi:hypothetical protein